MDYADIMYIQHRTDEELKEHIRSGYLYSDGSNVLMKMERDDWLVTTKIPISRFTRIKRESIIENI